MPSCWTREQLGKLFEACDWQTGTIVGVEASAWWLAIHLFWWDSGERTGATLKLEWEHFDPTAGTMYVPGDIRKTNKRALYDLKPLTAEAIEAIREPRRKLIFELPGCLGTFYNHYTRLLKDAGLPHGRRDKPQKMRRSFASHLEAAGGNATEALGHSARSVTKDSYIDERIVKPDSPNLLLFNVTSAATGETPPPLPGSKSSNGRLRKLLGRLGLSGKGKGASQ